jgi:hypothetical protein
MKWIKLFEDFGSKDIIEDIKSISYILEDKGYELGVYEVKKNNNVFYKLYIENADESVRADVDLLEEMHELSEWCFKQNKENKRIKKIRGNMNPAADLLDDDIWVIHLWIKDKLFSNSI